MLVDTHICHSPCNFWPFDLFSALALEDVNQWSVIRGAHSQVKKIGIKEERLNALRQSDNLTAGLRKMSTYFKHAHRHNTTERNIHTNISTASFRTHSRGLKGSPSILFPIEVHHSARRGNTIQGAWAWLMGSLAESSAVVSVYLCTLTWCPNSMSKCFQCRRQQALPWYFSHTHPHARMHAHWHTYSVFYLATVWKTLHLGSFSFHEPWMVKARISAAWLLAAQAKDSFCFWKLLLQMPRRKQTTSRCTLFKSQYWFIS